MLWIARTGSLWRDLPPEFGSWNSTYQRFARWSHAGAWHRVFAALARERRTREVFIDSTIVGAHQRAAGAPQRNGAQALGRSRGGLSTRMRRPRRGHRAAIQFQLVLGCVVHARCSVIEPGGVRHHVGQGLIVGEPRGGRSVRTQLVADLLAQASFEVTLSYDERQDIWRRGDRSSWMRWSGRCGRSGSGWAWRRRRSTRCSDCRGCSGRGCSGAGGGSIRPRRSQHRSQGHVAASTDNMGMPSTTRSGRNALEVRRGHAFASSEPALGPFRLHGNQPTNRVGEVYVCALAPGRGPSKSLSY